MTTPPQFPGNQPQPEWQSQQTGSRPPNQPQGPPQGGPQQQGGYPQGSPQQQGGYQQPPQQFGGHQPPQQNQGMSTGAKVLIGVLGVFFLLIAGCVAVVAIAGERFSSAVTDFVEEAEKNGDILEENATITECAVGESGTWTATVELTNPFPDKKGFLTVEVNFLEGSTVVDSGSVSFENLAPGQSASGEAAAFDVADGSTNLTCEIADATVF